MRRRVAWLKLKEKVCGKSTKIIVCSNIDNIRRMKQQTVRKLDTVGVSV